MGRIEADRGSFRFTCGGYVIECTPAGLPLIYNDLKAHAVLVDEIALHEPSLCCLTVKRCGESSPFLVVAQSYSPHGAGFEPGALLVHETNVLFVGAGERILAYGLEPPARLWIDEAAVGFLSWERHGDTILLSAELELAAWDRSGKKLWTTFVEPPWRYEVEGEHIVLDVMGKKQRFPIQEGPPQRS